MPNSIKRSFTSILFTSLSLLLCMPLPAVADNTQSEIDKKVELALKEFHKEVPNAKNYLKEAKGVLVIPDVKKVGFVIATQWGTGALQENGRTVGYYKMEVGSIGLQAGYQKADFVFIFFSQEALNEFRENEGWSAGAEAGLTLATVSTGMTTDSLKDKTAVAGFAFGKEGLMAGWSGKGTKFTRVELDK